MPAAPLPFLGREATGLPSAFCPGFFADVYIRRDQDITPMIREIGFGYLPLVTNTGLNHLARKEESMGISVSLILIAVGAVLTWAVTATVSGIDLTVVGVILMIVGGVGLILSMLFWSTWGGFHATRTDTTVVREQLPR